MKLKTLDNLIRRLKKINIEVDIIRNIPWFYVRYINGKKVSEKLESDYGFVIGYLDKGDFDFAYAKEAFDLIRKYRAIDRNEILPEDIWNKSKAKQIKTAIDEHKK